MFLVYGFGWLLASFFLISTLFYWKKTILLKTETHFVEEKLRQTILQNEKDRTLISKNWEDEISSILQNSFESNNRRFLELASLKLHEVHSISLNKMEQKEESIHTFLNPLKEMLAKFETNSQKIELQRADSFSSLREFLHSLHTSQEGLKTETRNLVRALRTPHIRGSWGEIQLKRVAELSGMLEKCDFDTQITLTDSEGRKKRPDMVVHLPQNRKILIDAKVPLEGYLKACEEENDEKKGLYLKEHAKQLRQHIALLSSKAYWNDLENTPEFIVLFLPSESIFGAACMEDPDLIHFGVEQKVLVASPTTLIALLRSASYGWQKEEISENAQEIFKQAKILLERLKTMQGHFLDHRRALERALESYNKLSRSYETRVLATARRIGELNNSPADDLSPLETIETIGISLPEMSEV